MFVSAVPIGAAGEKFLKFDLSNFILKSIFWKIFNVPEKLEVPKKLEKLDFTDPWPYKIPKWNM